MSDTDAPPEGQLAGAGGFSYDVAGQRRLPRWLRVLVTTFVVFVLLVMITAVVAANWHVNYVVISPATAEPVTPLIKVAGHTLTTRGQILLVDVYENPLTALQYVLEDLFSPDDQIEPAQFVTGTEPQSVYFKQSFLDMSMSKSDATAAALSYLGYAVKPANAGVLVYGVQPGAPAADALKIGQVIKAVNDTFTPTNCSLIDALHGIRPGTPVTLHVEQSFINDIGSVVPGPLVTKTVTVARPPKGLTAHGCGKSFSPTAYLGISTETQVNWSFPLHVSVSTPNIGGPSAGLAMALGILDKLSGGHLIGNRTIAVTGTIDQFGNVGQVGGVPQKTIAAERHGATVMLVPKGQLSDAKSKASPNLHVYAVSTLTQALTILQHLGGRVPANHVQA